MEQAELAFDLIPGSAPAGRRALFLHGILGSGANLRTIARRFVEGRKGWDGWTVDLRGHGASPKGLPGASLAAAAGDVRAAMARSDTPVRILVGHSLGGKVALEALRRRGEGETLAHVVLIDSPPGRREPVRGGDSALGVLAMLRALPPAFTSKAAFVDAVRAQGHGEPLARWLAMSTETHAGAVRFALELAELETLILDHFATDLWSVVESPPDGVQVHLVIGARSTAWSPAERARALDLAAREARVTVDLLPTDHWVHAEDPDGLLRVLLARVPG